MSGTEHLNSVKEIQDRLRVGRSTVYTEIASGRLKSVVVGRRRLVAESQLVDYIDSLIEMGTTEGAARVAAELVFQADVVQPGKAVIQQ